MYCKTFTLLRHSGQEEEFLMRQCTEADLSDIMELQQEERLPKCVSLEITIVDSTYRGYGLQRLFVKIREEEAKRHDAEESFVTIAPGNEYSLKNFLKSGYEIVETRPLYERAVRHILRKML